MSDKLRVLYAEDSSTDAELTKTHFALNAPELELDVVDTGQRCLARLDEAKYDVLLLDHHLPDMDGVDVLKELAAKELVLPVVVVTGVGDEALVVQVLRLGAWDYVPKQANYVESLPAVLKNAVSEYRSFQEQRHAAGRGQRRILYVEHNPQDIDLTLSHLAEVAPHLRVESVGSSRQALALLEENNIDLVLTDLRMPDMNALDLLRQAKHAGRSVPFIVITGQGDESAAVAALKLGAYDYIVKRDNYLTQLPYAIDNAIARSQLANTNRRLEAELAERERAQAEISRLLAEVSGQRLRLDEIIATVPGIVWERWGSPGSPDAKSFVSKYAERMLGYRIDQWLSTSNFWLSIVHPEDRQRAEREAAELFASGKAGISQFRWIAQDGRVVWVETRSAVILDDDGKPVGMRGVTTDITASKEAEAARAKLEEQLRQARKMESIGRLAGGVAHDFNNLVTVINGYADLLLLDLEPGDPLRSELAEIRSAGQKAADLTRQLLALSRKQFLQPRVVALNSLITDNLTMLKRLVGENISLVTNLDPDLGHVKADPGQVHQVIMNLAANSRDVMPNGGTLTLETQNVILDEEFAQKHLSLQAGSYVMLAISDTGSGMDAYTLSQIFEPFFTTKEPGKGTGLGLSMVYGVVKQSGGSIWVDSELGRGTTFKIYLPRIDEPASASEEKRDEVALGESDTIALGGSETVLVVEDEEPVRKLACQALDRYGYRVIAAAKGGEALLACEKHRGPIHMMVTDVVMPQMSGPELAARLRQVHPEIRVLYMSGYTDDAVIRHGLLNPAAMSFLQKPFTPSALAAKVRDILDQETAPPLQ